MTSSEVDAAVSELEALKTDIRNCTPPSQMAYIFAAIFPLIHQRIVDLRRVTAAVPVSEASGSVPSAAQKENAQI